MKGGYVKIPKQTLDESSNRLKCQMFLLLIIAKRKHNLNIPL